MASKYQFDQSLRELVRSNLQQHEVQSLDRYGRKHAAVAFTLVNASEPANIANIPYDAGQRACENFTRKWVWRSTAAACLVAWMITRPVPGS
jgi:hypothetical protein